MIYSCFDIGGTAVKYGLIDETGRFHKKGSVPTQTETAGGPGLVHKVLSLIQRQLADHPLQGIAISTAGIVEPETGRIEYAMSIPGYSGTDWKALIGEEFDLPCVVENDTNCAALGEMWLGAGKGCRSLAAVTVGTSIGGAVIVNGQVLHGVSHAAGEIAYMRVPAGRLHDVASASSLCRAAAKAKAANPEKVDGYQVCNWLNAGDPRVVPVFEKFCQNLADGLTNIISLIGPECLILGGGIMAREDLIRPQLEKALKTRLPEMMRQKTKLAFASLQNDAGMLGALYLLLH
ncbi:ROK family protein [Megasphaera sp.]|uniref:ROK family protein n=1 Tax=Megasphaera sp. TaxID=2023260 RepID=UPI003521A15C